MRRIFSIFLAAALVSAQNAPLCAAISANSGGRKSSAAGAKPVDVSIPPAGAPGGLTLATQLGAAAPLSILPASLEAGQLPRSEIVSGVLPGSPAFLLPSTMKTLAEEKARRSGGPMQGPGALSELRSMLSAPQVDAARKAAQAFDGRKLSATLILHGQAPVTVPLADLEKTLDAGDYWRAFNENGHLRIVMPDGAAGRTVLSESDIGVAKDFVRGTGLQVGDGRTRGEVLHLSAAVPQQPSTPDSESATMRAGLKQYAVRGVVAAAVIGAYLAFIGPTSLLGMLMLSAAVANADKLARETIYSLAILKASLRESKHPRWNEILLGMLSKGIPAIINIGVFAGVYHGHPIAFALSVVLSLSVETFHGVWVNAWDTFQSKIGRQRGLIYQNLFNFFYGQIIGWSYRLIAYSVLGSSPPWSWDYWQPMLFMTVVGVFCGTLGYSGLNSLYEKGRIQRGHRANIQQLRDFFMVLVAPFFATGSMFWTWVFFWSMQALDVTIYLADRKSATRPLLLIADEEAALSEDFRMLYLERSSPLKRAWDAVQGIIFVKLSLMLYHRMNRLMAPLDEAVFPPPDSAASRGVDSTLQSVLTTYARMALVFSVAFPIGLIALQAPALVLGVLTLAAAGGYAYRRSRRDKTAS